MAKVTYKILVIEDNPGDARLLQIALSSFNEYDFQLTICETLTNAIRILKTENFSAVLLDLSLPDSKGLETFTKIKVYCTSFPVIILSGNSDSDLAVKAVQNGAQDYLIKGEYDASSLLRAIRYSIERKKFKANLAESEARFRNLADTAPVLIWMTNSSNEYIYFNKGWLDFRGKSLEEEILTGVINSVHKDDRKKFSENFEIAANSFSPFEYELRIKRFDNQYRWFINKGVPRFSAKQTFEGYIGTCTDITERKQNEEKNIYQSLLIYNVPDALIATTTDMAITFWSKSAEEIYGWKSEDVLWRKFEEILPTEIIHGSQKNVIDLFRSNDEAKVEVIQNHIDGHKLIIETKAFHVKDSHGRVIGYASVNRDITERKKREIALRNSEESLKSLINAINESVLLVESDGNIIAINSQGAHRFGKTVDEMLNKEIFDFIDSPIVEDRKKFFETVLGNKRPMNYSDIINGRYYDTVLYPVFDESGNIFRIAIYSRDFTEERIASDKLRYNESLFNTVFNSSTDAIFLVSVDKKTISKANLRAIQLFEFDSESDLIGLIGNSLHLNPVDAEFLENINEKLTLTNYWQSEVEFKTGKGNNFWGSIAIKIFNVEGEKFEYVRVTDITSQKEEALKLLKYSEELQETNAAKDKLFSIISHDLRSPFHGLIGLTGIVLSEFDNLSQDRIKGYIKQLYELSSNQYNLVENLLEWSQLQRGNIEPKFSVINLYQKVKVILGILEANFTAKNISVSNEIAGNIMVVADEKMLSSILQNILSNAIKFTYNNGRILIYSNILGNKVQISIADSGIGMSKTEAEVLFKGGIMKTSLGTNREKGTGLGLTLCKELIKTHNQKIWASSAPQMGTTINFTLTLFEKLD